jgi:hypothetical protein
LAVCFGVIALLIALLLPAQRRVRPAGRRTQCKNNLKQIGLALHNYHDVYGAFPPAFTVDVYGKPLHSWRTLILPYFDQLPLYQKIDLSKPWDDPANAEAFQAEPYGYSCPSANCPKGQTTYLAVAAPNSAFGPVRSRSLKEITDGTSETLMVIEAAPSDAVHWMAPQDADETLLLSYGAKTKDAHTGGRHALLADGAVRFLSNNLPATTLQALISAAGKDRPGEW